MNMKGLMLCSKLFVASLLFLTVNANTIELTGHNGTLPSSFPQSSLTGIPTRSGTSIQTLTPSSIPQSSLTGIPTRSGTSIQTLTPSSIPQSSPSGPPTRDLVSCEENEEDTFEIGKRKKTCKKLSKTKKEKKESWCNDVPFLSLICPITCEICSPPLTERPTSITPLLCEENEEDTFGFRGKGKITCKKLSKKKKKEKWCNDDTLMASLTCPITCEICSPPPTDPPTPSFSCSKLEKNSCKTIGNGCKWIEENTCTFRNKKLTKFKQKCGELNGVDDILTSTIKQCQKLKNKGDKKICKVINGFCFQVEA